MLIVGTYGIGLVTFLTIRAAIMCVINKIIKGLVKEA
jgi:hypothetical protein